MGKTLMVVAALVLAAIAGALTGRVLLRNQYERGWEAGYAQGRDDWSKPCLPDEVISGERNR